MTWEKFVSKDEDHDPTVVQLVIDRNTCYPIDISGEIYVGSGDIIIKQDGLFVARIAPFSETSETRLRIVRVFESMVVKEDLSHNRPSLGRKLYLGTGDLPEA